MTPAVPLLTAAIGDLLGIIVPIVFLIIYALNHLLAPKGNRPQARNPQRRVPEQVERPLQQRPAGAERPAGNQAQLNAEIEQFLKRAGQRREERPTRARPTRARSQPAPTPKAPPKPPRPTRVEQPIDVQPIERHEFDSVAASVAKHMSGRGFAERAEHLADDVAHADEQMEQHLHQVFDRRLGTLGTSSATAEGAAKTPESAAASIAAMLSTPQGMRQAIILGEILQRPEHRW